MTRAPAIACGLFTGIALAALIAWIWLTTIDGTEVDW